MISNVAPVNQLLKNKRGAQRYVLNNLKFEIFRLVTVVVTFKNIRRRAVWYVINNILEEHTAYIFKIKEYFLKMETVGSFEIFVFSYQPPLHQSINIVGLLILMVN
jgi:hypothetical protein